ncbi:hypothetical protein EVAR_76873_1 [Eumeta japonica]|uniref:Uncharacterized protein n=1 Tax=Eumeta variegata TaxID=151549 RepID=A0A4C1SGT2_EUMVA|nr:hypothetical protein EVAR_76873_1 [Eumeta japonica]
MSASARARATQKWGCQGYRPKEGGYGPRISTPMSGAGRVGRLQERRQVAGERSVGDVAFASVSTAALSVIIQWFNKKCIEYSYDNSSSKLYQWFDVPTYKN